MPVDFITVFGRRFLKVGPDLIAWDSVSFVRFSKDKPEVTVTLNDRLGSFFVISFEESARKEAEEVFGPCSR